MKKSIVVAVLLVSLSVTSAFANNEKVSPETLASFNSEFSSAKEVTWQTGSNYYRAEFSMNEQKIFAYYNLEGELVSVARYISALQLPINLFTDLKNDYGKYWISDLFEVSNSNGVQYYVTLEDADTKLVMLSDGRGWSNYSKNKKV